MRTMRIVAVGMALLAVTASAADNDSAIVQKLLDETVQSQLAWLKGDSAPAARGMSHTEKFTIFGPFGGPSPRGWNEQMAQAQGAAAKPFQGGSTQIELVQSHVTDKLIVLVTIEHNQVKFAGYEEPQNWTLRVTQVYEPDGKGHWRVVHRHADPLLVRRDLAQTLKLMPPLPDG